MNLLADLLVTAAFAFAFSMGAHYTGACMGMSYASGAIRPLPALLLMAPLTLAGAALASGGVESTVGHGLLLAATVPVALALATLASAFLLTTAFNLAKVPTSTIQLLVFSVVGAGLAHHLEINWGTIERLLLLWAIAPFAASALGYLLVRVADRRLLPHAEAPSELVGMAAFGLVAMGSIASFAMGANDVSNASGAFIMTGLFSPLTAGLIGGAGLALGVLTWGQPLLKRVAFEIVQLDPRMATSAQLSQAAVILSYVSFGYFTSMNQALVGAMIGAGFARPSGKIKWAAVRGIAVGWGVGPLSGAAVGAGLTFLLAYVHLL
ncbi:MAG: anion permease [Euryarchaeota archaeon]|nr:anion permease [Euryarchaeota archaeon]MDE1880040.1 anion permease [Euryarchaeota archaeon]